MKPDARLPDEIRTSLGWRLRLTHAGLLAERITRAFWPVWTLLFAILAALAFGFQDWAPLELFWLCLVAAPVALVVFILRGAARFRLPTEADALQRLDARLPGRPLAALSDHQALGQRDPQSRALWQANLARMRAQAARARAVAPDLRLAARDRYALRYAALCALVLAALFGSFARVGGLGPPGPAQTPAATASWEGWAEPPAYTGKPGLYLTKLPAGPLNLPLGTKITLRLYGQPDAISVQETVSGQTAGATGPLREFLVTRSGTLKIAGSNDRDWTITMVPDAPPTLSLSGPMARKADGTMQQPFRAADDYGIAKGQASFALDLSAVNRVYGLTPDPDPLPALQYDLPRPTRGSSDKTAALLAENASEHPWANLPVTMTLAVTDASGQTAQTEPHRVILPGRRFFDPLAAALIEVRRDLLWSGQNSPRSLLLLRALSNRPKDLTIDSGSYLMLRTAIRQLDAAGAVAPPKARTEVAAILWTIAKRIEDGGTEDARARLKQAQDRLSEAMRRGADSQEIEKLMDDLRRASRDYMRKLAEDGQQDPADKFAGNQKGKTLTADQLQQMMDEIQRLMDEGKMDEAQQRLEQLSQLMENLKVTQNGSGDQDGGPGGKAMRGLRDTLKGQQDLSDDAFRQQQQQYGQGNSLSDPGADGKPQSGQAGQQGAEGQGKSGGGGTGQTGTGESGTSPKELAQRQQALRQALKGAQDDLPDLPGKDAEGAAKALGEAGRAMDQAEKALRDGDLPGAIDRQAEAIDKLRQGLRGMNNALARNEQQQRPADMGQADADPNGQQTSDPLGRTDGGSGLSGDGHALPNGPDTYRRARDLMDEIRKRAAEQDRPADERGYLNRLLKDD